MVEYVLGSSPTTPKDLEPRMVSLRLVSVRFVCNELANETKLMIAFKHVFISSRRTPMLTRKKKRRARQVLLTVLKMTQVHKTTD